MNRRLFSSSFPLRSGRHLAGWLAAAVLLPVLAVAPVQAQSGGVQGHLVFPNLAGPPYPRVQVRVEDGQNEVGGTFSDAATGDFSVSSVPAGTYTVSFVASCYTAGALTDVTVGDDVVDLGSITMSPATSSAYSSVKMAGTFNGWNIGAAAEMTADGCSWTGTVTLTAGEHMFKFALDGSFDPSYGDPSPDVRDLPGGPYTVQTVTGPCCEIRVYAPVSGDYTFTLDESRTAFTVTYEGVLPQGSVEGTVAFQGIDSPPYPQATVGLYEAGTTTPVRSTRSDAQTGAWSFTVVPAGSYDVVVSSSCFEPDTVSSVTVADAAVDVGPIALDEAGSAYTTISLAGDFNGWDVGALPMTQDETCLWMVETTLEPGTYNFKFVTDGSFDNPPDYGGDESTLSVPGTYPVTLVTGIGTALRIEVTQADFHRFTLDERNLTFTVAIPVAVESTTWGRIKARY